MLFLRGLPFLFFSLASLTLSHRKAAVVVVEVDFSSSSFTAALETLQKQIGHDFQTVDLLCRAMTHPSYSLESCRALSVLGLSAIEASVALCLLSKDADASAEAVSRWILEVADHLLLSLPLPPSLTDHLLLLLRCHR